MITGATGYVAGWLLKKLLKKGITVHAAVRNPEDEEKLVFLNELAVNSPGKIKYFKSDLLNYGSYAQAMEGCELVFHTASPFALDVNDPVKDLIEPAQLGTRNVLEQANNTLSVKRVVLTSSCAAIFGDNADLMQTPNHIFTEEIWNTSSTPKHNPYSYSKTLAEKEAWHIHDKQSRWDLVVINPSLVLGPAVNPLVNSSESFKIIKQFGDGTFKTGVPKLGFGIVDVRDLAFAHYQAGFVPEAKGRHIVSGHNTFFLAMAKTLLPRYGNKYPIPQKEVSKWLIWFIGPMLNKALTRKFISRNVGYPWIGDNSKSKTALGVSYRPLVETMTDTFQQLIDNKIL